MVYITGWRPGILSVTNQKKNSAIISTLIILFKQEFSAGLLGKHEGSFKVL
jgi:hypothetical protein